MDKNVLVLGGGISGCSVAYYLTRKGYDVSIIEQADHVGGLCSSYEYGGVNYEFGPHICYASDNTASYELFHKLIPEFKPIKYFPKQSMDGKVTNLATFPITVANVLHLPDEEKVKAIEELYHVNLDKPQYDTFENYIISRVGQTMYEYCYKNYNKKQWALDPKDMDSEWATYRNFFLRSGDYGMFGDKWQGHPEDYNPFFRRLIDGVKIIQDRIISIEYEERTVQRVKGEKNSYSADYYISTLPLDMALGEKDSLQYRGITKLYYLLKGQSGFPTYLCTFPNNYCWTRITDYVLQAEQNCDNSLISFAVPHSSTDTDLDIVAWKKEAEVFIKDELNMEVLDNFHINQNYVYPISSAEMLKKYNSFISKACEISNLLTFGRLGLYAYISMCTAVDQASNISEHFEELIAMDKGGRLGFYMDLRRVLS